MPANTVDRLTMKTADRQLLHKLKCSAARNELRAQVNSLARMSGTERKTNINSTLSAVSEFEILPRKWSDRRALGVKFVGMT